MSIIISRAGNEVDTSGRTWQLGARRTINLGKVFDLREEIEKDWPLVEAFVAYLRHLIPIAAPDTIRIISYELQPIILTPAVRETFGEEDASFLIAAYNRTLETREPADARRRLGICRRWYTFCADEGFEGFEFDAAIAMNAMPIGAGCAGVAIRRLDPDEGPLSERDARTFERALWDAVDNESAPLTELTLGLCYALLGVNLGNAYWLNECDLKPEVNAKGMRLLMVPRIKKGQPARGGFRRRWITPAFAAAIEALVEQNRRDHPPAENDDLDARPLYLARTPVFGTPFDRASRSMLSRSINRLPGRLGITTEGGAPMRLTARRLRYTFGRRQVVIGKATPMQLADLLDHSSLGTVLVYYDPRFDLIPALDAALTRPLSPYVAIAMGATTAPAPIDIRAIEKDLQRAPHACLDCRKFRPVARGPIVAVATSLLETHKRLAERVGFSATDQQQVVLARLKRLASRADDAVAQLTAGDCDA